MRFGLMSETPASLKERAKHFRMLARNISDPRARTVVLDVAKELEQRAAQLEAARPAPKPE